MARNVEHICDIRDKWCQEGANPYRHPDHNSHKGGCICPLEEDDLTNVIKSAKLEASRKIIRL